VSTGGPPAVQQLLEAVEHLPVAVLVAQHMPAHFTQAFAERLDHMLDLTVREAKGGETPEAGHVYLAPGGAQLELGGAPGAWRVWVSPRDASDKFAPSVDRLFRSAARTAAADATAVVLTGMGNDGAEGVKALAQAGAEIWAEDEASAVVFGMPGAAIATGCVQHVFPLERLRTGVAEALLARARRRGGA
jgi:two-component system chemotaxis response regulator CheB